MYTPSGEPDSFDLQPRIGALLEESLALLDKHDGPLALRARIADLIGDLDDLWA